MKFALISWCFLLVALGRPGVGAGPRRDAHGDALPNGAVQRLGTIRLRHSGMVHGASFSPDGKYLATSGEDGPIRLWGPRTGKLIRRFEGPNQRVYSVAFSPDSKQLASTGGWPALSLHIWNVETGAEVHGLGCSGLSTPWAVAWSPDGKLLASAHGQGPATIALWDPASGKQVRRFRPADSEALSVVFTRDSKRLVSGGSDGSVQLWDVGTGKEIRLIGRAQGWAFQVALSPDGKTVAAAGNDRAVRLWELETGKEIRRLPRGPAPHFPGITGGVTFSSDGKKLVTGGMDRTVRIWGLAAATPLLSIEGGVPPLALAPDDATLAMTGRDHALRLWDVASGKEIPTPDGPRNAITALAVSPDGRATALGVGGEFVRVYDTLTGKELRHWAGHEYAIHLLRFAPDGKELLSWCRDADFWDVSSGKRLRSIPAELAFAGPAVYSPDGQSLAFRSGSAHVVVWDVRAHRQVCRCGEGPGLVRGLSFAPDGKTLAVASDRNQISFWDATTGKRKRAIRTARSPQYVAFTPAGNSVVSDGCEHGGLGVWDAATGKLRYSFGGHPGFGLRHALSPDGRLLASCGAEHTIVVRELASGSVRRRLKGHLAPLSGLTFGPSSRVLISASHDTTALVWDVYAPLDSRPPGLATLWDDLASPDGEKAHAAMVAALRTPDDAVAVLKKKLRPAEPMKPEVLARWIDRLVDDNPGERKRATAVLIDLGEVAAPALRRVLNGSPAPQLRQAVESVLNRPSGPVTTPGGLQVPRAVELLTVANTPEARVFLEALARGAPGFRQTREAIAAMRSTKKP
jgi:WD40 repeat protein